MIKTKQELLNYFSDINAMYNNPFMYQTLSNMIDELLEQQPCEDAISREEVLRHRHVVQNNDWIGCCVVRVDEIINLPSVTPSYNSVKTELKPSEDCISREKAIKQCGFGMTSLLIADCLKRLPSVTPSYNSVKTELEQTRWIPVSDPLNELPKDRWLYVTTKVGCVETLVYDMTEWSDADIARSTVAYMDYYEPHPYEAEREDKG